MLKMIKVSDMIWEEFYLYLNMCNFFFNYWVFKYRFGLGVIIVNLLIYGLIFR